MYLSHFHLLIIIKHSISIDVDLCGLLFYVKKKFLFKYESCLWAMVAICYLLVKSRLLWDEKRNLTQAAMKIPWLIFLCKYRNFNCGEMGQNKHGVIAFPFPPDMPSCHLESFHRYSVWWWLNWVHWRPFPLCRDVPLGLLLLMKVTSGLRLVLVPQNCNGVLKC